MATKATEKFKWISIYDKAYSVSVHSIVCYISTKELILPSWIYQEQTKFEEC